MTEGQVWQESDRWFAAVVDSATGTRLSEIYEFSCRELAQQWLEREMEL
jgi:hypothetical protein